MAKIYRPARSGDVIVSLKFAETHRVLGVKHNQRMAKGTYNSVVGVWFQNVSDFFILAHIRTSFSRHFGISAVCPLTAIQHLAFSS